MVVEQVTLNVIAGREAEILAYLAAERGVVEGSAGCRSFMFGRGVEDPSKVMIVAGWDSLEAHKAATQSPAFQAFSKGLIGFVTGAAFEHFAVHQG